MSYAFPPDLHKLVEARLASGRYSTEDEDLRDALRALAEEDEDLVAVRDAVAEWRAGDTGIPLTEALEQAKKGEREARASWYVAATRLRRITGKLALAAR